MLLDLRLLLDLSRHLLLDGLLLELLVRNWLDLGLRHLLLLIILFVIVLVVTVLLLVLNHGFQLLFLQADALEVVAVIEIDDASFQLLQHQV